MLLFTPIYHINFTLADMVCFKWFSMLVIFFYFFFKKKNERKEKPLKTCHISQYEMGMKSNITLIVFVPILCEVSTCKYEVEIRPKEP
jgi:hypothetical protein